MNSHPSAPWKIDLPSEIRTERLVVRSHRLASGFGVNEGVDLARIIFAAVDADRARLRTYLPWVDLTRTEEDQAGYVRRCAEAWAEESMFDFGLYLPDGTYLGNAGLHTVSKSNRRAELGYWILGKYERHGYVTEAIGALGTAAFKAGFHRLEIRCNGENAQSYGVAERLGYVLEGKLREDFLEHGRWRNTRIYGQLAREAQT
jgi:RimJ/RimL family protein N-acetyltransferase